jgi:hypothetical protein
MTHRLRRTTFGLICGIVALLTIGLLTQPATAWPEPAVPGTGAEKVKWDVSHLQKEPLKLIRSTPDLLTGQVRFLLEFTRAPQLSELFDWQNRGGPVVFRFLDADGVVIRTVKPRLEGEILAAKGARIRLILQMPDLRTLELTQAITAD